LESVILTGCFIGLWFDCIYDQSVTVSKEQVKMIVNSLKFLGDEFQQKSVDRTTLIFMELFLM